MAEETENQSLQKLHPQHSNPQMGWISHLQGSFPGDPDSKEASCSAGDPGSIPGPGRSPGERNDNPLQYSCLRNPMDRGAWQTTVHGVTKSWTRLSDFTFSLKMVGLCCTFYVSTLGTCTRKTSHQICDNRAYFQKTPKSVWKGKLGIKFQKFGTLEGRRVRGERLV